MLRQKKEKKSIQEHRSINLLLALKFLLKMSSILNELKQEIKETTKYFKFLIEAQKKKKEDQNHRSLQRETGSQIRAPILRKEAGGKIKVEKL